MYPEFKGSWKATCQLPIILSSGDVCMRMVFSGYTGDINKLAAQDKECLSPSSDLWVDISMSPLTKNIKNKHIAPGVNLRDLVSHTYP